jgi:hypothetical protein
VPRARAGLALLGVATILLLAVGATPAETAVRPLETGVSYVYDEELPAFENVRRTGSKFAMTPVRWGQIAPLREPAAWQPTDPADPHYDWEPVDQWLRNAVQVGLTPVLQIRSAPHWAQRCIGETEFDPPCDPDPGDLAAFATAAAQRYGGRFGDLPRVRYWQGLNEPNLSFFFNPQFDGDRPVSPFLYRALINAFYAAIKAVDPSNLVIAAGLAPVAIPGYSIGPMRFARLLLCMTGGKSPRPTKGNCEGGVNFDIFDIHPYTTGGPTHEGNVNDVELGDLDELTTLLKGADAAGRIHGAFPRTPLWIMEFAWDSKPPDPGGLKMKIETRWAAEALHRAWRTGIEKFFWYSLRDAAPEPRPFSETLQSGLYFRGATIEQDRPKKVLFAFRFPFVAYPRQKGLYFWGRTPTSKRGRVRIQLLEGGRWRTALVTRADAAGIFAGLIPRRYGRHKRGAARAVYQGQSAIPFSMRPVPDFPQPPFG